MIGKWAEGVTPPRPRSHAPDGGVDRCRGAAPYGTVVHEGGGQRSAIYRATSTDGVKHAGEAEVLGTAAPGAWDAGMVSGPSVVRDGQQVLLRYTGEDETGGRVAIGLATSSDGVHFTRHAGNPVLTARAPGCFDDTGVFQPVVRKDGERFVMVYAGATGGGDWERARTISLGAAWSYEGVTWTRLDASILAPAADWEASGVFGAAVLLGDEVRVYYSASDADCARSIGLATGTLTPP